jgi:hypothetical protein
VTMSGSAWTKRFAAISASAGAGSCASRRRSIIRQRVRRLAKAAIAAVFRGA